ncbi:MAG: protein-export chaperone SecB [Betaproteobacteria bacterium RIFCSPLOWO2_02_64_14]|nr:MAG: protein-export chaperone SecB [Betaproteobacteria bacterium RIFCSPLOWO2_02_64_14]
MSEQSAPVFGIEKLYLKDMSLEVPGAPQVFLEREAPQIDVRIHDEARALEQEGLFEVVLTVTVTAKVGERTMFLVEAAQAGVFQIRNVPQHELGPVLGILCPNTLLPYAREVVAGAVMRAGFPPVVLSHMSFEAVYQQRMEQLQQAQAAPAPTH